MSKNCFYGILIVCLLLVSIFAVTGCGSDNETLHPTATNNSFPRSSTNLSIDEVKEIAKNATDTLLFEEENDLQQNYPSPNPELPESYLIENFTVSLQVEHIEFVEELGLWVVPVHINYQIHKLIEGNGGEAEPDLITSLKTIYIDDSTGNIIPEMQKLSNVTPFLSPDGYHQLADGRVEIYIHFKEKSLQLEYYWEKSDILKEICICQDNTGCPSKPINPNAYVYIPNPTDNWEDASTNILASCDDFQSIKNIGAAVEQGDYFLFSLWATQWQDRDRAWVDRHLVRGANVIPLKFEKSTGKIYEERWATDTLPDNQQEWVEILVTEHNAINNHVFWYIPVFWEDIFL